jgi:hypothetical protein
MFSVLPPGVAAARKRPHITDIRHSQRFIVGHQITRFAGYKNGATGLAEGGQGSTGFAEDGHSSAGFAPGGGQLWSLV